jgi:hypothetical protein
MVASAPAFSLEQEATARTESATTIKEIIFFIELIYITV